MLNRSLVNAHTLMVCSESQSDKSACSFGDWMIGLIVDGCLLGSY